MISLNIIFNLPVMAHNVSVSTNPRGLRRSAPGPKDLASQGCSLNALLCYIILRTKGADRSVDIVLYAVDTSYELLKSHFHFYISERFKKVSRIKKFNFNRAIFKLFSNLMNYIRTITHIIYSKCKLSHG